MAEDDLAHLAASSRVDFFVAKKDDFACIHHSPRRPAQ
jgi:hypothetical protein